MFKIINKIRNKEYSKDAGFSLLELAVAVGIAAIITAVSVTASTLFVNNSASTSDNYAANANSQIVNAESSFNALWDGEVPPGGFDIIEASLSVDTTSTTIAWAPSARATSYVVYLGNEAVATIPDDGETYTYTFLDLTDDTTYSYKVEAVNAGGAIASSLGSFTTVRIISPPSQPVNLEVSNIQPTTATLTWGAPNSGDPVVNYIVIVNNNTPQTLNSSTLTVNLTGLTMSTSYTATVTAVNSGGESIDTVTFTTPSVIVANGGMVTTTTVGNFVYRVHTFTNVGASTFDVVRAPAGAQIEYLIVAGGGGGGAGMSGSHYGGGGGAGGLLTGTATITAQPYTVTVGGGGTYTNSSGARGANGGNSAVFNLTALGGGGGAGNTAALSGGSGGGASYYATTRGAGTSGQGFRGGTYNTGGQGAPGGSSSGASPNNSTVAAPGTASLINGSNIVYARGGDGNPLGTGGSGSNNGNGGKGGRPVSGQNGNNGTSGTIIIRYAVTFN